MKTTIFAIIIGIVLTPFLHADELTKDNIKKIVKQYEEACIKEQKDTPTISILESAYPPEIKYKPRRTLIVLITFVASLTLAIFLALFGDYLAELRRSSPADFELLR